MYTMFSPLFLPSHPSPMYVQRASWLWCKKHTPHYLFLGHQLRTRPSPNKIGPSRSPACATAKPRGLWVWSHAGARTRTLDVHGAERLHVQGYKHPRYNACTYDVHCKNVFRRCVQRYIVDVQRTYIPTAYVHSMCVVHRCLD